MSAYGQPTVGLVNNGSTCYMNVILQCLYNIEDFSSYFQCQLYIYDAEGEGKTVSAALNNVFNDMSSGRGVPVNPLSFKEAFVENPIGEKYKYKGNYECIEFLDDLLRVLHNELLSVNHKEHHNDESFYANPFETFNSFIEFQFKGIEKRGMYTSFAFPHLALWVESNQRLQDVIIQTYKKKISRFPKILIINTYYSTYTIPPSLDLTRCKSSETTKQNSTYSLNSIVIHTHEHYYAYCKKQND